MADDSARARAALALGTALDGALRTFARENEALLRQACDVPAEVVDLSEVVACTFFGHTLEKIRKWKGRRHAERVTEAVLDQHEAVERAMEPRGTLQ